MQQAPTGVSQALAETSQALLGLSQTLEGLSQALMETSQAPASPLLPQPWEEAAAAAFRPSSS